MLQPLTHTLLPFTYQVCWRSLQRTPKGQPQCWGVCDGGSSVPMGLWLWVRQAALGSGPRAQRRRASGVGPTADFGTGCSLRGLETRGLQKAPRRSHWALCWA